MVDFTLKEGVSDDFFDLIPYQRVMIKRLFELGKLHNYALSVENARLWAVFNAHTVDEVEELVCRLPISKFTNIEICLLTQFDGQEVTPMFSLN